MVSEFNQWREILPSNMAAGLFIERLLGNKQSRMVERIGSILYVIMPHVRCINSTRLPAAATNEELSYEACKVLTDIHFSKICGK